MGAAEHGNRKYQHRCQPDKPHTDGENPFLLDIISVSVVKPNNGRYSHRVADIQCVQQELRVDNNGNCRNAIFSQQVHHGAIEQECRDGCCQLAHYFGGAIETALPNHGPFQFWPCERQRSFALRKIDQPGNRGDQIAETCPQSSAPDAQAAGDNENVIQNDIRHASQNRQPKTEARFSRRHKQV